MNYGWRKPGPILLLQGPVGGFFGYLGRHIRSLGIEAEKVQFNLADCLIDRSSEAVAFRAPPATLASWYRDLFRRRRPRAVVVFGDRRPIHACAKAVAQELGIPFFSFEEGYIRPHFVTFERDGNNALSPLARDLDAYPEIPPPRGIIDFETPFRNAAFAAILYFLAMWAGRPVFPKYAHHRKRGLFRSACTWPLAAWRWFATKDRDLRRTALLARECERQYYILALQVFDDLQLQEHGRGFTPEGLIETAMASFARHAPPQTRLIIKQHPLDRGERSYAALIRATARQYGVQSRVTYMLGGNQPALLHHARGLVTINSTIAISALYHHCPVFAFGDAFYKIPGLVFGGNDAEALDRFWTEARAPDPDLVVRHRNNLIVKSQLNGSFYVRSTWPLLARQVIDRLTEEKVIGPEYDAYAALRV